jgi:hypothetical protein
VASTVSTVTVTSAGSTRGPAAGGRPGRRRAFPAGGGPAEVAGLIRGGQLRFLYLTAVPGLPGVLGERAEWARGHCVPVPLRTPSGMTLFDCAASGAAPHYG